MTRLSRWLVSAPLLAFGLGCASMQLTPLVDEPDRHAITQDMMVTNHFANAHDAVSALRPHWLEIRGKTSNKAPARIVVYVDDIRRGDPTELYKIGPEQVWTIEFLEAQDATTRYGTGHIAGAIIITSP